MIFMTAAKFSVCFKTRVPYRYWQWADLEAAKGDLATEKHNRSRLITDREAFPYPAQLRFGAEEMRASGMLRNTSFLPSRRVDPSPSWHIHFLPGPTNPATHILEKTMTKLTEIASKCRLQLPPHCE
jgi:hypothetical protein